MKAMPSPSQFPSTPAPVLRPALLVVIPEFWALSFAPMPQRVRPFTHVRRQRRGHELRRIGSMRIHHQPVVGLLLAAHVQARGWCGL